MDNKIIKNKNHIKTRQTTRKIKKNENVKKWKIKNKQNNNK